VGEVGDVGDAEERGVEGEGEQRGRSHRPRSGSRAPFYSSSLLQAKAPSPLAAVPRHGQPQEGQVPGGPEDVLPADHRVELRVALFRPRDELVRRLPLVEGGNEEVRRRDEQVVAIGEAPGDGRVAGLVDELVVVQVVRGNPRERGVAVKDRQPLSKPVVGRLARQGGAVVVIVGDHRSRNAEVEAEDRELTDQFRIDVLREHRRRCEHQHPEKGSIVGAMARLHGTSRTRSVLRRALVREATEILDKGRSFLANGA